MIHTYRIEYIHDDGEGERIERAYSADDAIVQFKVYAAEHLQRALATKIEPVEDASPTLGRPELAKQGLTFGGALHWLRMGAKVRRPCWDVGSYVFLSDGTLRLYCGKELTVDFGNAASGAFLSDVLLATDWEVLA